MELLTIRDHIRWGASRLNEADAHFGHGTDNALDEAAVLVLHALHLPPDLPDSYGNCRLTSEESERVLALLQRRFRERVPAPYLTGEAWFAGLCFRVDRRVLIPRSPIAELIEHGFEPWLPSGGEPRMLDLCTGSGCIAVATAVHLPGVHVDAVDLSPDALAVARENCALHQVTERVHCIESDLFEALAGSCYDLIVCNPPYVGEPEMGELPEEYRREPRQALASGEDGMDLPLKILWQAADHLHEHGVLIMEVGFSAPALQRLLPTAPFLWLEFERGGEGVFVLDRDQLVQLRGELRGLLEARMGETDVQ